MNGLTTPGGLLPPHPDPWHIYTRTELDAYETAAAHIWAVHHLLCDVPICQENRPKQLERHAYPGQPSAKAQHVIQPCCCTYRLYARSYNNHPDDGPIVATTFHIHPACPHHGHRANTHLIERLWQDPYLNGLLRDPYDMDDDERRD